MVSRAEVEAAKTARRRGRRRKADDATVEKVREGYAHKFKSVAIWAEENELSIPTIYKIVNGEGCYPYAKIVEKAA
jgi:hypothetical protein